MRIPYTNKSLTVNAYLLILTILVSFSIFKTGKLEKTVVYNKQDQDNKESQIFHNFNDRVQGSVLGTSTEDVVAPPTSQPKSITVIQNGVDKSYVDQKVAELKASFAVNSQVPLKEIVTHTFITKQNDSIVNYLSSGNAALSSRIGALEANSGGSGSSQWSTSGSDIYYTAGKVGIGTNEPFANLDVQVIFDSPGGIDYRNTTSNYLGYSGADTLTDAVAMVSGGDNVGVGTITNVTNLKLNSFASNQGGTIINQYALKIDDIDTATNNWAIKTGLGKVEIGNESALPAFLQGGTDPNVLMVNTTNYSGLGVESNFNGGVGIYGQQMGSGSINGIIGQSWSTGNAGVSVGVLGAAGADGAVNIDEAVAFRAQNADASDGAVIDNAYGLFVENQTAATNNWAIKTGLGKVIFGDTTGIATTSPWRTLSVTGTVGFDGLTSSTGAGSLCLSSTKQVVYNSASDACLSSLRVTKHDIATSTIDALSILLKLDPATFIYNEGDNRTRYGFMAEDTALVDDHLATHDAEGNISGIDDRAILSVVVKAIKDLYNNMTEKFDYYLSSHDVYIKDATVGNLKIDGNVCVDDTCVTKDQFKQMLLGAGVGAVQTVNSVQVTEPSDPVATTTEEVIEPATTTPITE